MFFVFVFELSLSSFKGFVDAGKYLEGLDKR